MEALFHGALIRTRRSTKEKMMFRVARAFGSFWNLFFFLRGMRVAIASVGSRAALPWRLGPARIVH